MGQGYDDIVTFDLNKFVESIFNSSISLIDKKNHIVQNKIESVLEKDTRSNDTVSIQDQNESVDKFDNLKNLTQKHEEIYLSNNDESIQETQPTIAEKEYLNKEDDLKNKNNTDFIQDNQKIESSSEHLDKLKNNSDENDKKKSFFSSLFRKKSKTKTKMFNNDTKDDDDKLTNKDTQTDKLLDNNRNDDNDNTKKQKNKNDVMYLSDEDIDELLKE